MGVITTSMSGTHGFLGITGSAFLYQHGRRRRLSSSGSFQSGSGGVTSGSGGSTSYSGSGRYSTFSTTGSIVSGSRGSTSASAGITVHSGAHGYFTFSTSGSVISGSRGSTSGSAGETTYSGSSYYTISHSGSMVSGSGGLTLISTGAIGIGTASPATALTVEGTVTLKEQSAADSDTAAYGQIWVKDGTPNTLYFTDDAGTDTQLGAGSGRSVAGDTDNGVITWVTSDNTFAAEANMTFDGSTLTVTGAIKAGGLGASLVIASQVFS